MPLPNMHRAAARLQLACVMLRRDFAFLLAPGAALSEDEFKSVLMFSLIGLASSFFLAAKARAAGLDEILAGILLLSS